MKFYVRRNNNKVDSIETGHVVMFICFAEVINKIACTPRFLNQ